MGASYLDKAGLTYFWGKVKTYVNNAVKVTGVKGNAESSYRTGNVNLTAANIGAIEDVSYQTGATTHPNIRPYIDRSRANRLAFLPADQIIIEKTTDGGATWTDAGIGLTQKLQLFSTSTSIKIPRINGQRSTQCGVRVTITGMKYDVPANTPETEKYSYWNSNYVLSTNRYANVREWWFWISSAEDRIRCEIQRATGANPNSWSWTFNEDIGFSGWSGSDWIRAGGGVTFGGGTNQTGNYWNWRLTFWSRMQDGKTAFTGTSEQAICTIRMYGDNCWTSDNNMMAQDHLYSYDYIKNATFPAKVTATEFVGNLAAGKITGTLGVDHGGTGQTTAQNAANAFMNALATGSSTPADADYYISQYVNGGSTTTTYHRRPMSALWEYVKGKISSVLGLTVTNYGGTSAKATADASGNTITSYYAPKSTAVTGVAWDSTNKKLTKTIDGTTTDVVTASTLRTGLNVADGAEVNQNAFSNVKVGSTTVAADSKTDTLELVAGSNVTLTPDSTNDKVTIEATDTTYSDFTGATTSANGTHGLVPAPATQAQVTSINTSFLSASGNWMRGNLDAQQNASNIKIGFKANSLTTSTSYIHERVTIDAATTSAAGVMSSSDKSKLDSVDSNAEVNQNAFSKIAVSGQTTVEADSKTDTLTLVAGNNVTITTDASNDTVTIAASGGGSGESIPAGVISPFAGSTAPTNWLLCDGSAVSRTTYSALFAVIGTTYGSGNGSSTFNLPDLRGRTAIGAGLGTASNATDRALGTSGGNERITLTLEQIPSHYHEGTSYYDGFAVSNGAYGGSGSGQALNVASSSTHTFKTASAGEGQSHGNMQPYLTVNYIIHI